MSGPRLEIIFAAENLLPPLGGAERATLEWLEALAWRHAVRAVWLGEGGAAPGRVEALPTSPPPPADGYWLGKRRRAEAVGRAVETALAARRADVVLTTLHAAPAAVAAARRHGVATVLALHSYESLCKYAFAPGADCRPRSRCRDCAVARALSDAERHELFAARDAHERALVEADALVAPSRYVAEACYAWCGRRPTVVHSVGALPAPVPADPDGHVLLAAARWQPHKGLDLLEALAAALAPRRLAITADGLDPARRARLEAMPTVELRANAPIDELLTGARAALVPSQWPEPFGRIAFEAMGAGVPTLASAVGGLPEFVPAPQLVSPPDSVEAWRTAVATLDDRERWAAARRAGLAAAAALLHPAPAERLEALLLDAAATRAATV